MITLKKPVNYTKKCKNPQRALLGHAKKEPLVHSRQGKHQNNILRVQVVEPIPGFSDQWENFSVNPGLPRNTYFTPIMNVGSTAMSIRLLSGK